MHQPKRYFFMAPLAITLSYRVLKSCALKAVLLRPGVQQCILSLFTNYSFGNSFLPDCNVYMPKTVHINKIFKPFIQSPVHVRETSSRQGSSNKTRLKGY